MEQQPIPQAFSPQSPVKPLRVLWFTIGFLIILLIGYALGSITPFELLREKLSTTQLATDLGVEVPTDLKKSAQDEIGNTAFSFEPLPLTEMQSYVVVEDGKLVIVPLEGGEPIKTGQTVAWGTGSASLGTNEPTSSPDSKAIAFINENQQLVLMTGDGKHSTVVSDNLKVAYLSGWSPDSQKLIVYAAAPTIQNTFIPDGPVPEEYWPQDATIPTTTSPAGFYVINLENSSFAPLSILEGVEFVGWIDSEKVLIAIEPDPIYVSYDIETGKASALLSGMLDGYQFTQFSLNGDGTYWALTLHPKPSASGETAGAKIVLAPFPKIDGVEIASGAFAQVQGPRISPDGKQVIFVTYDYVNGPHYVHLYDGNESKRLFKGVPGRWVNNHQFLYREFVEEGVSNSNQANTLYLYDTNSGESKALYTSTTNY